jgi:hypothetical protein
LGKLHFGEWTRTAEDEADTFALGWEESMKEEVDATWIVPLVDHKEAKRLEELFEKELDEEDRMV